MTVEHATLYAVKITRGDGSSFFAYSNNTPFGLWSLRREAVAYKQELHAQVRISLRKMKVVKVSVLVTEQIKP